jgi:hypothetical protein
LVDVKITLVWDVGPVWSTDLSEEHVFPILGPLSHCPLLCICISFFARLAFSTTLNMENERSSETSENVYQIDDAKFPKTVIFIVRRSLHAVYEIGVFFTYLNE